MVMAGLFLDAGDDAPDSKAAAGWIS